MYTFVGTSFPQAALCSYSQARWAGNTLYLSGQIALNPKNGSIAHGDAAAQTKQVLNNIMAVLSAASLTPAAIVQVTIYLVDIQDFAAVNEVYATFFSEPFPARSCVAVRALPKGCRIEIDAVAYKS